MPFVHLQSLFHAYTIIFCVSPLAKDAHEMFHILTGTLDEEAARYPSVASLFDADSIQVGGFLKHNAMH